MRSNLITFCLIHGELTWGNTCIAHYTNLRKDRVLRVCCHLNLTIPFVAASPATALRRPITGFLTRNATLLL